MTDKELKQDIIDVLNEFHCHAFVPGRIFGQKVLFDEYQVRALQVLCKRTYEQGGDEAFQQFIKKYTVYSDMSEKHEMIFRTDGKFNNDFEPGFFDIIRNLAFEIL